MEELNFDTFISLQNSLNPNDMTITRVGIIPILLTPKNKYYIMGVDRKTKKLSDFGGHCIIKNNNIETPINCLTREMREEMGILMSSYIINKINDINVRKISKIFSINRATTTQKIEIFLKFEDSTNEIIKIVNLFEPNDEIESIGFYKISDILNTTPSQYISSVELFMNDLLK